MELNSCIYETNIMHCRLRPKRHQFMHKIFMFYLDLDELDVIARQTGLVTHNRMGAYAFNDDDHFKKDGKAIKEKLKEFFSSKNAAFPDGKIMLLTNLRTFGHLFNPVPMCVVPEIGNTFGEIKPFLLDRSTFKNNAFIAKEVKYYYISPFIDLDVAMEFKLPIPDEKLNIHIDDFDADGKLLYATMTGRRKALNTGNLLLYTLKFPFVTVKVIGLIHFHAFLLWLKRVPHVNKEENPHYQREVYRVWKGHKIHLDKNVR